MSFSVDLKIPSCPTQSEIYHRLKSHCLEQKLNCTDKQVKNWSEQLANAKLKIDDIRQAAHEAAIIPSHFAHTVRADPASTYKIRQEANSLWLSAMPELLVQNVPVVGWLVFFGSSASDAYFNSTSTHQTQSSLELWALLKTRANSLLNQIFGKGKKQNHSTFKTGPYDDIAKALQEGTDEAGSLIFEGLERFAKTNPSTLSEQERQMLIQTIQKYWVKTCFFSKTTSPFRPIDRRKILIPELSRKLAKYDYLIVFAIDPKNSKPSILLFSKKLMNQGENFILNLSNPSASLERNRELFSSIFDVIGVNLP